MSLTHRIEKLLWARRAVDLSPLLRWPLRLFRFLFALLRDVTTGPLTLHAMGLVYVTILSLVPLLAVSLSVLKGFGLQRQLEPVLYQMLAPLGAGGAQITASIIDMVDHAQGDVLAGLGLVFLFFTALTMAEQVERSINEIWRVERPRNFGRRLSEYLAVLIVGPVLMVTAMTLIARLQTASFMQQMPGVVGVGLVDPMAAATPYLLVGVGFSFVYWYVPNTRVRLTSALAGGLIGGGLWAGTGAIFAAFVVNAATTITIYASFAIAITALFWLYLCWLILLVGAQVAFYAQNPDYMRTGYRQLVTGTGQLEQAALAVMLIVARAFRDSAGATLAMIGRETRLPRRTLSDVVRRLEAARLLARTDEDELLPQRDVATIQLRDIIQAMRHPENAEPEPEMNWPDPLTGISQRIERGIEDAVGEQTLAELMDGGLQRQGTD